MSTTITNTMKPTTTAMTTTTTTTTSNSFSSFLSTKTNSEHSDRTQFCFNFDENETSIKPAADMTCPYICLSECDEETLIIQNLKTRIEPNHDISEAVNRAIARYTERVDRQIEIVENGFKSINDEIEHKILEASQALDKSLNVIDNSLSGILKDRKSDEFMRFDSLQKCFLVVNDLINERNQNITSFMSVLHEFEKERTALIKDCYQKHMLDVKQLSGDSFERLYEKYLKNYNAIKLGNFRTYEDLRYQLIQWSSTLHQEFILRAYNVKIKIKKNIGESFKNNFISDAKTIISDTIEYTQLTLICLLNDINKSLDELIKMSKKQMDIAFILKCSDSLKMYSKNIDNINENLISSHDEAHEAIRLLLAKTVAELDKTIMDSNEFLSPNESTVINNAIMAEAINFQQEKMKTTLEVQLLLSNVKNVVNKIVSMIRPAIEIICGHSGRLMKARDIFLVALDMQFKTNDSELEIFENNFNEDLEALVQASDETNVSKFENKCIDALNNIKDRLQINRKLEMKVISDYIDLITVELDVVRLEVQVTINLFPESLKALPKFNDATQNESWSTSVKTSITTFETAVNHFQYTLNEGLWAFLFELKSVDTMNNENMAWTRLLEHGIDERFNVAEHLVQLRIIGVQGEITKKRIDEIEQHKNLLERHTKAALETSQSLKHKINELFKLIDLKKKLILKNVKKSSINELTITELTEVINELRYQIYLAANEINDMYKSLNNDIESKYRVIENSTLEFMKSIKMFPEGGNYGHEEAVGTIHVLSDLSHTMNHKKASTLKKLKKNSYESVTEIKGMLYELIKPVEIVLDKKVFKQKYYSIYKLLNVTTNQEILNLEKILDSLHTKLNVAKKVFEKKDVTELSKCWFEILSETNFFIDFVVESYQDIQALLVHTTKKSIWNTKSEKSFILSSVATNSKHTFTRRQHKFYDYCKTIICCGDETVTDRPRFLKNIYSAIFHYVSESQINAADLAMTESADNTWIDEEPNTAMVYAEIMAEAVKNSRTIALQSELIWILKLSEFFDLFTDLYAIECQFKNAVLATYHEDSVKKLNETSNAFRLDTEKVRKQLKTARQEFHYKLKPSHGHPRNTARLESLMGDFQLFNAECAETLSATCDRIVIDLEIIAKNYEAMCPKDILTAATVYVKCYMKLKTLMEHVDDSILIDTSHRSSGALPESSADHGVQLAVGNVKSHLQTKAGTIFWPDNNRLWTGNVQVFSRLCRERFDDVQTFGVVEKAKMIDWATTFVRDVERVKELNGQYVTI